MFNALRYSQELEKAGFSREQAQASMNVLIEVMNENFALKSDLKEVEMVLRSDMKAMESSIRSDMKAMESTLRTEIQAVDRNLRADFQTLRSEVREMEYKLTIKMGTMMTLAIGVTATLVKLL